MIEAVAVIIPAHNEEALIEACLAGVLESLDACGRLSFVVVVADACVDDTTARSRRMLGKNGIVVQGEWRSAGRARAVGTAAALGQLGIDPGAVWLANTDADSIVRKDWISRQLAYSETGYDGVAGIVTVADFVGHPASTARRFAESYELPSSGDHPHVHGANIGILASSYLAVGGWPHIALAEDHGLWNRLRAAGCQTISPQDVVVSTSGRPFGRAAGGFADTLRKLGAQA